MVLIEGVQASPWSAQQPDLRVYAFAPDNAGLFDGLASGIRSGCARTTVAHARLGAAGGDELVSMPIPWAAANLLDHQHGLLLDRLGSPGARRPRARAGAVEAWISTTMAWCCGSMTGRASMPDCPRRRRQRSTLRSLARIELSVHDYAQRGVVAYWPPILRSADAWQRFLQSGPLAFLPCADDVGDAFANQRHAPKGIAGSGVSSIVWTLPMPRRTRAHPG